MERARVTVGNEDVARALEEFSQAYEARGDPHRTHAYARAAATVRALSVPLTPDVTREELDRLPHVGPSIAQKIRTLLRTGRVPELEALKETSIPREFHEIVGLPGVGPKLASRFKRELGIDTVEELEAAARAGRLRAVPGVGERLEARVITAVEYARTHPSRLLLPVAQGVANALVEQLREVPEVLDVAACGSLRREKPTIGDVDVVVATRDAARVTEAFTTASGVVEVTQRGKRSHVRLTGGVQADLYTVRPEGWGAALSFFTGSREHTIELRGIAERRGWKLNNEGLWDDAGRRRAGETESGVYEALGLRWIPPELRENRGEIEAARRGDLPDLVRLEDLRGDAQMHTRASDGRVDLEEMVSSAAHAGRAYVAVTDHTASLRIASGMDDEGFAARLEEIRDRRFDIPVLVGAEVDILPDGSLDLAESTLERLDFVLASVHQRLRDPRARITRRVVDALSTGLVDVLGHPTNRRLNVRPPSDLDFERVFEAAQQHRVAMEINANPERMDLPGALVKRAKEQYGLKFTISTDAHAPHELDNLRYGLACARRGWLTAEDVLTTLPFEGFSNWVRARRRRERTRAGAPARRASG